MWGTPGRCRVECHTPDAATPVENLGSRNVHCFTSHRTLPTEMASTITLEMIEDMAP